MTGGAIGERLDEFFEKEGTNIAITSRTKVVAGRRDPPPLSIKGVGVPVL